MVKITTTTTMPMLKAATAYEPLQDFIYAVNQHIAGLNGQDTNEVHRFLKQQAVTDLEYQAGNLHKWNKVKYPNRFFPPKWLQNNNWKYLEPIFWDIVEMLKPKLKENQQTPYQQLVYKVTHLPHMNQYVNMYKIRDTYQPFGLAIQKLYEDYAAEWELLTDNEKENLLTELVKRICRKPEDGTTVKHILRHISGELQKQIDEKTLTGLREFNQEMTDLFMTWENDWNGASNKCGHMTVDYDPMPRDYQPIRYDSAGNPLTMSTRARETIVNSEHSAQRREKSYKKSGGDWEERSPTADSREEHPKRSAFRESHADRKERLRKALPKKRIDERPSRNIVPNRGTTSLKYKTGYWQCWGCGRIHEKTFCALAKHPDWNWQNVPWNESTKGIAWAERGETSLPANETLDGHYVEVPQFEGLRTHRSDNNKKPRESNTPHRRERSRSRSPQPRQDSHRQQGKIATTSVVCL